MYIAFVYLAAIRVYKNWHTYACVRSNNSL